MYIPPQYYIRYKALWKMARYKWQNGINGKNGEN